MERIESMVTVTTNRAKSSSRANARVTQEALPLRSHPLRHHVRITVGALVLITQVPFLFTIWNSLHQWNMTAPNDRGFVWFQNYARVFRMPTFGPALINSLTMTIGAVACAVLLGLCFALAVNRKFFGRGLARTLLFIPFLVPPAAAALMWKNEIFNPSYGLLNFALAALGVNPVDWVNQYPMLAVIAVAAWQWVPFSMIILLAGLQSQSMATREAAMIDGASSIQAFWHITLPHLRPYIELSVLLSAIFTSQLIDPIVLMTQGGPGVATTTLPYLIYNTAFRGFDVGLSSAMGVIVVVGTIVTVLVLLRTFMSSFKEQV